MTNGISELEQIQLEQYREQLAYCYTRAQYSPDPSTQNAACLVGPKGDIWPGTADVNRPTPRWVMEPRDWERPRKYSLVGHAERACLYYAARCGIPTDGCTLVACWASCAECAIAIVESGISRLVRHKRDAYAQWNESIILGDAILRINNVEIIEVVGSLSDHIPNLPMVRFDGKLIQP